MYFLCIFRSGQKLRSNVRMGLQTENGEMWTDANGSPSLPRFMTSAARRIFQMIHFAHSMTSAYDEDNNAGRVSSHKVATFSVLNATRSG